MADGPIISEQPEAAASLDLGRCSAFAANSVSIGDEQLPLADFLIRCVESMSGSTNPAPIRPELIGVRDAFLDAGVTALRRMTTEKIWLQYGFPVVSGRRSDLYAALGRTARELLAENEISEFFYMHKPPGLRVRFETANSNRRRLETFVEDRIGAWRRDGLIKEWRPAVYEPEAYLFGGPVSMRSVHRLFTADSLAWLGYHELAQGHTSNEPPGAAWAMSLVMVRILFDVLDIAGWEDLDVWDRLRWQMGRQLGNETSDHSFARLVNGLRQGWSCPDKLQAMLSPQTQRLVGEYGQSIQDEGVRWVSDYFTTREAIIGPREAAAYIIVFHWNRGGFPIIRQALIAEALAARTTDGEQS